MSKRALTGLAFGGALLLTAGAWREVMIYKSPSPRALALWLPCIVLFRAHGVAAIIVWLLQFPVLATVFVLASGVWRPLRVLLVVIVLYAGCVWAAAAMLGAGMW